MREQGTYVALPTQQTQPPELDATEADEDGDVDAGDGERDGGRDDGAQCDVAQVRVAQAVADERPDEEARHHDTIYAVYGM